MTQHSLAPFHKRLPKARNCRNCLSLPRRVALLLHTEGFNQAAAAELFRNVVGVEHLGDLVRVRCQTSDKERIYTIKMPRKKTVSRNNSLTTRE